MNSQVLHDHLVEVNRCYFPEQLEPLDSAALELLDKLIGTKKNIRTVFNTKAGNPERGSKGGRRPAGQRLRSRWVAPSHGLSSNPKCWAEQSNKCNTICRPYMKFVLGSGWVQFTNWYFVDQWSNIHDITNDLQTKACYLSCICCIPYIMTGILYLISKCKHLCGFV